MYCWCKRLNNGSPEKGQVKVEVVNTQITFVIGTIILY